MLRILLKSKIHRATVTFVDLNYEGSVTIDEELMRAADILPYEQVHVVNVTTGARFESYAIAGPPGSGTVGMNGGAARLAQPGDLVILMTFAHVTADEVSSLRPRVVRVDARNRLVAVEERPELTGQREPLRR